MKKVKIGSYVVGENEPIFVIAEIGINHNGDVTIAKKLIDMAVYNGCNAVKFQKRTPELCDPEDQKSKMRETPWGYISYIDYKKRIEFGEDEYSEIDSYCKEKGIIWFASAWDIPSVDFLEKFDIPCYKIASAALTDMELMSKIKSIGKPIILSTGMSTMEQVKFVVDFLGQDQLILTHCNSSYPSPDDELNLRVIQTFIKEFECPIGYSGHETGMFPTIVAMALGAVLVERHITLDRSMWGTDQSASLSNVGLYYICSVAKIFNGYLGDGVKRVMSSEESVLKKLRHVL